MIPRDYRLENVCARLVERLEGTRRSYVDRPEQASTEFLRVAREHGAAAVAEWGALDLTDEVDVELHAAFLSRELENTFLPRYERLALAHTTAEEGGYGFGMLARPSGRVVMVLAALFLVLLFGRLALFAFPLWSVVLASLSLPLWPDIAATLEDRRYAQDLGELLADMARVQAQSSAYQRPDKLRLADEPLRKAGRSDTKRRKPNSPKETP